MPGLLWPGTTCRSMSLMTDDEVNEILDTVEHMLDGVETPNLDALRRRNGHGGPPNNGARCPAQWTGSLRSPGCNPIGVSGPDLTSPGTGGLCVEHAKIPTGLVNGAHRGVRRMRRAHGCR